MLPRVGRMGCSVPKVGDLYLEAVSLNPEGWDGVLRSEWAMIQIVLSVMGVREAGQT